MAEPAAVVQMPADPWAEIRSLRKRVADLERLVGSIDKCDGILMESLGEALHMLRMPIEQRLDDLEQHRIKFMGVFEHGSVYPEGSMVTKAGSLWYATKETRDTPGEGSTAWQLAVKKDSLAR